MIRLTLLIGGLCLALLKTYGQYTVYQDEKGQVLTTFDIYSSGVNTASHNQIMYIGSPFLTFPVWQEGSIQLDKQGQELRC